MSAARDVHANWRPVYQGAPALSDCTCGTARFLSGSATALHDDHGPCAPLGPLSAEEVQGMRDMMMTGLPDGYALVGPTIFGKAADDLLALQPDLRDEKIESLTTLVTEMGAIIAEQSAQMHTLGRRIEALADRVSALEVGVRAVHQWHDPQVHDDNPTMRAMSSLRAKGLA